MIQYIVYEIIPSVLWHCWLGGRKGIRPVKKTEWWGVGIQIGFIFLVLPFWYQLTRVVPDKIQKSHKMFVCVCCIVYGSA